MVGRLTFQEVPSPMRWIQKRRGSSHCRPIVSCNGSSKVRGAPPPAMKAATVAHEAKTQYATTFQTVTPQAVTYPAVDHQGAAGGRGRPHAQCGSQLGTRRQGFKPHPWARKEGFAGSNPSIMGRMANSSIGLQPRLRAPSEKGRALLPKGKAAGRQPR